LIENEVIHAFNEAIHLYHEYLKMNFQNDNVLPDNEITSILKLIRDATFEKFYSASAKTEKSEHVFQQYKQKLVDFINEKEISLMNVNGEFRMEY
jgi:hypothetical protein